ERRRTPRASHRYVRASLPAPRPHEGRPAALLRGDGARPAPTPPRPRDGRADAGVPPALARALLHRARRGERRRSPRGAGPALASLDREPRLHRPEPVVRAL